MATDNFNRADENPLNNGTWDVIANGGLKIVSNVAKAVNIGVCASAWKVASQSFSNIQGSKIVTATNLDFDHIGAGVFLASTGGGRGYVALAMNDEAAIRVFKLTAGALGSALFSVGTTLSATDTMEIKVDASGGSAVLTLHKNGSQIGTSTDSSSPYTSGQPGVAYNFDNTNASGIDAWDGVDYASASATRGTPFGHRGTALNGGRTFQGILQRSLWLPQLLS